VRAMPFHDPSGAVRVVFVTSDAPRAQTAVVLAGEGARMLRDALSGERIAIVGGRASIPVSGVRMLIVES
jgi:hypothetical protein